MNLRNIANGVILDDIRYADI